jgi:hypothetical protein
MAKGYQGRHAAGVHRSPAGSTTSTTSTTHRLPGFLRRPLVSAAAILTAAAVCAAASEVRPPSSDVLITASPLAAAQAAELSHNQDDTNAALAAARRSGVQRASALTHHDQAAKKAAADEAVRARVREALELVRLRAAATERVARAKVRSSLLVGAQSDPKAVGRLLAADRGWSGEQFGCLDNLWTKESGWRWNADNPSSDAYGIPQALPGSKMSSAGSDWASNPVTQIRWGLQYISARYGSPCSAWAHSRSVNWY